MAFIKVIFEIYDDQNMEDDFWNWPTMVIGGESSEG